MDQVHEVFIYDADGPKQFAYDSSGPLPRIIEPISQRTNMIYDRGLVADEPIITDRARPGDESA